MRIDFIPCPSCQGEGYIYRAGLVFYETGCGHPYMGEVCEGLCPDCDGKGDVEVMCEPRTLADLEQEDFDLLQARLET